jgi:hypothetical protein
MKRRITDELERRQWADYSLRPKVREFALHILNKAGSDRELVNEIWCDTLYDFTLVESIKMSHPEPMPSNVKRGYNFVMIKIKISGVECPMVLPYLYHDHETIGHNSCRVWKFFNSDEMGVKHVIQNLAKSHLPSLEEIIEPNGQHNGDNGVHIPKVAMFGGRALTILDPLEEERQIKESHSVRSTIKLPGAREAVPRETRRRKGRKAERSRSAKRRQGGGQGTQLPAIR